MYFYMYSFKLSLLNVILIPIIIYQTEGAPRGEISENNIELLYSESQNHGGKSNGEIGLLRSKNENPDGTFDKIGVLGYEIGADVDPDNIYLGAMGRVIAHKGQFNIGPVKINVATTFDSGIKFSQNGGELKILGIGGKLNGEGIQVCFIICVGFNWPW